MEDGEDGWRGRGAPGPAGAAGASVPCAVTRAERAAAERRRGGRLALGAFANSGRYKAKSGRSLDEAEEAEEPHGGERHEPAPEPSGGGGLPGANPSLSCKKDILKPAKPVPLASWRVAGWGGVEQVVVSSVA